MQLGNPELPISQHRREIVGAVNESQAVIIEAETGAGKSTQVVQMLAEEGYEVVITQPRIVAARNLSERVRDEIVAKMGPDYDDFVGYRTARERHDSPNNRVLFATDGLQLMRELYRKVEKDKKQVLVLDEVHEWNENMEVLAAWAKKQMNENPNFKVVVMSATMDTGSLSAYFADNGKREVPVIEVPGRTFEVAKREGGDVVDETIKFAKEGKNTLVFMPGKGEIDEAVEKLKRARIPGVVIVPLHGQQTKADQQKAFSNYDGPKVVVATNVAETSLTIPDVDVVVDSGMSRQVQVKNGVEGLFLHPIPQANCLQRAGRAGRVKEGEYVLAHLEGTVFVPFDRREAYETPEILRTRLDGTTLRLAKAGMDISDMEFYNVVRRGEAAKEQFAQEAGQAKKRLHKLGALTEDGKITKIGRQMERMPLESHYARMMIEARKYSPEVRQQLAAMLAVQEAGGVRFWPKDEFPRWMELTSGDSRSDMLVELEVMIAARRMSQKELREHNIIGKNFSNAQGIYRQLRGVEKLPQVELSKPNDKQREQLVKCIIAGMVDNLFTRESYGYVSRDGVVRTPGNRSVITRPGPDMLVGEPFDLQSRGGRVLNLIQPITEVPSLDVLREVAPQLFSEKPAGLTRLQVGETSTVGQKYAQYFDGRDTGEVEVRPAEESEERREYLIRLLLEEYRRGEYGKLREEVNEWYRRAPSLVTLPNLDDIQDVMRQTLPISVASIEEGRAYVPQLTIDDIVPHETRVRIEEISPLELNGYELHYSDGEPRLVAGSEMSEDEILALDPEEFVLPDGREIRIRSGWYGSYSIRERQQGILEARERAERMERERHERSVRAALDYLRSGYKVEYVTSSYGEKAATEAYEQYRVEEEERRVAKELERQRRQQEFEMVRQNIETYENTVEGLFGKLQTIDADAPEDMQSAVRRMEESLEAIEYDIRSAKSYLNRGHLADCSGYGQRLKQIQLETREVMRKYNDWKEEDRRKGTKLASEADIFAALGGLMKR